MKNQTARTFVYVVFFICMMAGCTLQPDAVVPALTPAPGVTNPVPAIAPTAPAEAVVPEQTAGDLPYINTSAVEWLEQKLSENVEQQELSGVEIERLNDLACRLELIKPFFRTDELEKKDFTFILYNYYQQVEEKEPATPPDGMGDPLGYGTSLYLSSKKASALLRDILGADIPDATADYADVGYGDTICKDGVYYIYYGDLEHWPFSLGAYRYLGENIFYLSFDVDDTHMAGPENEKVGIIGDYCRLLVKRSDSEWGFTVLSKLKERDHSILPDNFPLPQQK